MGTRPSPTAFSISGPLKPRDPPGCMLMTTSPPVTCPTTLAKVLAFSTWKLPSGQARGRSHSVSATAVVVRVAESSAAETSAAAGSRATFNMVRYLLVNPASLSCGIVERGACV